MVRKYKLGNPDSLPLADQKQLLEKELAARERSDQRKMNVIVWIVGIAAVTAISTYIAIVLADRIPGVKEARLDDFVRQWNYGPVQQARVEEDVYWHQHEELPQCNGEPGCEARRMDYIERKVKEAGAAYHNNLMMIVNMLVEVARHHMLGLVPERRTCELFVDAAYNYQLGIGGHLRALEKQQGEERYWTPLNRFVFSCCDLDADAWEFCR